MPDVERTLRASRPEPDPRWVADLERRLLVPPRRRRPGRPLVLGAVAAGALATLAIAFGLASLSPLGGRGRDRVEAVSPCRWVTVVERRRVPALGRDAAGAPAIVYRLRTIPRRVRRCG